MPEPVAKAEVGRYCSWPTQASSYLTGCLEILAIRDRYLARRGFATVAPQGRAGRGAARVPRRDHLVGCAAARPGGARGLGDGLTLDMSGRTRPAAARRRHRDRRRAGAPVRPREPRGGAGRRHLRRRQRGPARRRPQHAGHPRARGPGRRRGRAGPGDAARSAPLEVTPETHGPRGLGYAEPPDAPGEPSARFGPDVIVDEARRRPGELTLVTLGPARPTSRSPSWPSPPCRGSCAAG